MQPQNDDSLQHMSAPSTCGCASYPATLDRSQQEVEARQYNYRIDAPEKEFEPEDVKYKFNFDIQEPRESAPTDET